VFAVIASNHSVHYRMSQTISETLGFAPNRWRQNPRTSVNGAKQEKAAVYKNFQVTANRAIR
jgi:hypothetical protein